MSWLAVLPAAHLRRKPYALVFEGHPLVLFRDGAGRACALEDRCPHRNVPLSAGRVEGHLLVCPYHGWAFDGEGACRRQPGSPRVSECRVPGRPVLEQDGLLFLAAGEPGPPPPPSPWKHYQAFFWTVELDGSFLNVVENFLDATHTHFVHAGLIRSPGSRRVARVEVVCEQGRAEASYFGEERASGLLGRLFEGRRHSSHGRFLWPATAEVEYRSARRAEFVMTAHLSSIRADRQRAVVVTSLPRSWVPVAVKELVLTPFLRAALEQDRRILRLQRDNLARFGEERFRSTERDVLRSHIQVLLERGPGATPLRREIEMEL